MNGNFGFCFAKKHNQDILVNTKIFIQHKKKGKIKFKIVLLSFGSVQVQKRKKIIKTKENLIAEKRKQNKTKLTIPM